MMKNTSLQSLAAFALAATFPMAASAGPCDAKVGNDSVCVAASKLAAALSVHLPANEGMVTIDSVKAKNSVVTMGGRFDLDKARATEFLAKNRLTLKQFEDTYTAQMTPKLCVPGSQTRQIIDAGGAIMYSYTYRDGKPFLMFGVKKCT